MSKMHTSNKTADTRNLPKSHTPGEEMPTYSMPEAVRAGTGFTHASEQTNMAERAAPPNIFVEDHVSDHSATRKKKRKKKRRSSAATGTTQASSLGESSPLNAADSQHQENDDLNLDDLQLDDSPASAPPAEEISEIWDNHGDDGDTVDLDYWDEEINAAMDTTPEGLQGDPDEDLFGMGAGGVVATTASRRGMIIVEDAVGSADKTAARTSVAAKAKAKSKGQGKGNAKAKAKSKGKGKGKNGEIVEVVIVNGVAMAKVKAKAKPKPKAKAQMKTTDGTVMKPGQNCWDEPELIKKWFPEEHAKLEAKKKAMANEAREKERRASGASAASGEMPPPQAKAKAKGKAKAFPKGKAGPKPKAKAVPKKKPQRTSCFAACFGGGKKK